jgi:hypothetical protein
MRSLRALLSRVAGFVGKSRRERDLVAEIESHLQLHTDDNLRSGMNAQEARRAAILKLGGIEATKENYRERRSIGWLEVFLHGPGESCDPATLRLALQNSHKIRYFENRDAFMLSKRQHVAKIPADDEIAFCGDGAFEDPVIGRVGLDDIKGRCRCDTMRVAAHIVLQRLQRIKTPLELVAQYTQCFYQDCLGNVEADFARSRYVNKTPGQPAKLIGEDINIGVRCDTEHRSALMLRMLRTPFLHDAWDILFP